MRLERNLRLIDAYTLGTNALFFLPIMLLYYRDEIGLGFREFLIAEAAFATTLVLLEVPTGWISDAWQRRHVQALGIFMEILGCFALLLADSFFMAVLAQVLIGTGISLCSGTNTSILYDTLLSARREGEYRRREGRRQAMGFYTVAVTSVAGGLAYTINHHLPLYFMVGAFTAALIASCLLDEPERHRPNPEKSPLADIAATVKYVLRGHAEVGFIILFSATLFAATKIIMWTQQSYYMALAVPEAWYGVLTAAGFLLGGAASHSGHLLDGKLKPVHALALLWAATLLVCLAAGLHTGWHGVLLLMFGGTCIFGMASPRVNEVINKNVDSSRRATALSTQNLTVQVFFIPLSMMMGSVSKNWGVEAVLLGLAAWLCLAGLCLALSVLMKKRRQPPAATAP